MKKIFTIVFIAFVAFANQAFAISDNDGHVDPPNPVYFKAPFDFAGTGCPQGSVVVKGTETNMLKVYFDQYDAAKPKSNAASRNWRTSCNFAVPVHVPQGYQASIGTIDWQGYAKGSTELRRTYFFAGRPFVKPIVNYPKGDYLFRDVGSHESVVWSGCGADIHLRLNSSIKAKSNNSYIAVDTLDFKGNGVVFGLQWRKCP